MKDKGKGTSRAEGKGDVMKLSSFDTMVTMVDCNLYQQKHGYRGSFL